MRILFLLAILFATIGALAITPPTTGDVVISGRTVPGERVAVWHGYSSDPVVGTADSDGVYSIEYPCELRQGWHIFAFSFVDGTMARATVTSETFIPIVSWSRE